MTRTSACAFCKHYNMNIPSTCVAFPVRIPAEFLFGEKTHNKPYPGDHGLRFEPSEPDFAIFGDNRNDYEKAADAKVEAEAKAWE